MATVGSLIQDARRLFGDTDGEFLTDTIGLEWMSVAQERFCETVIPLDEIKDFALTARLQRYDLPDDCIEPVGVMWYKDIPSKLTFESPAEFDRIQAGWPLANPGRPRFYTVFRRQVVVGPNSPAQTSATVLASGDFASSATTIGFTAASGILRSRGWLIHTTSGEVVEYLSQGTTQVTGCSRGQHNTSTASIASNDQFKQVDMQLTYRRMPTAFTATTQTPDIPKTYHRYLIMYFLYRAWLARGDSQKAQVAYNEFSEMENSAIEKTGRRAIEPIGIKDRLGRARREGW